MARPEQTDPLPYRDTKPIGAADFYFAINATFRFVLGEKGIEGLRRYWSELGASYYRPVSRAWKERGLSGVAAYWRAFLAAEPGAEGKVHQVEDRVEVEIRVCPAIKHLRGAGRKIVPCFCQHCFYQGEAMAARADMAYRLRGGDGTCRHTIHRDRDEIAPQDLSEIRKTS